MFPKPLKTEIIFEEARHKYFDTSNNQEYISVTTFLSKYKTPFDLEGKSLKKAQELGITQDEVKKMWEDNKNQAADYGTAVHLSLEHYAIHKEILDNEYKDIVENAIKSKIFDNGKLFPEKLIYYNPARLAGTSDLIKIENGRVHILDYKTNKSITTDNYRKFMKAPISNIPDSKFHGYELQLSIYAWMCQQWGLKMGDLTILWINPDTRDIEFMPCRYRKKEVELLIKDRLSFL